MKVVEKFVSINGEGQKAGQLALFIRFAGCNLNCEYCDTKWANEETASYTEYTPEELVDIILESGIRNVTLTGGEPLLQKDMARLLQLLEGAGDFSISAGLRIEIETNGSVDMEPFLAMNLSRVTFTLDYKTGISGMEDRMYENNFLRVREKDTVKFVVGSEADLIRSKEVMQRYGLLEKGCGIYLSPCFGKIDPADIVAFLVKEKLNGVTVQLQLHKFIWDPDKRGV